MDIIYRLVSARMDELRRLCLGGAALLLMTGLLAPQAAQAQDRTPGTTPETTESAATPKANPPSKSLDDAFASESGNISTSIDGVGTNSSSAIVQVDKPSSGATVRRAFLVSAAAFRGDLTSLTLSEGSSSLTIDPTDYDARIDGAGSTENGRIEITSFISSIVDPASAGLIDITVEESSPSSLDGTVLAVIFDDPNVSETRSVSLVFGSQDLGGDSFSIGLAEPFDDASQDIEMSLGISFGFQGGGQVSLVDVNGTRMTSSAGGQDDCDIFEVGEESCGNGALLTVGGIGDDPANPDDPFNNSPTDARVDDELYTLDEFIDDGDTQVSVETENPSFDDNIFFAAFVVKGGTAVVGEGITLAPSSATNPAGTDHTVTATVQDADGSPVSGRDVDFEITAGPNAGLTGSDVTDSNGEATFTWSSSTAGTDVVIAETVDSNGDPLTSNQAKKTWTAVCDVPSLGPERIDRSANTVTNTITDNEGIQVFEFTVLKNFTVASISPSVGFNRVPNTNAYRWVGSGPPPTKVDFTLQAGPSGQGTYFLEATDACPVGSKTLVADPSYNLGPSERQFRLAGPNPFGDQTTIEFGVPEQTSVSLSVYNLIGQKVATLVEDTKTSGLYTVSWDGQSGSGETLPSGTYLLRLQADGWTDTRRVTIVR